MKTEKTKSTGYTEETLLPSIRLHNYDTAVSTDLSILFDCAVNTDLNAKEHLTIAVPDTKDGIAKLTHCYLQAFRTAKNQGYKTLALPVFGSSSEDWTPDESFHSLKNALMIFWRSGALDGETFPDMDLYLLSEDETCREEILKLCTSAFSVFLCDLPNWNSKGDRRMWEHLMHVFAEKETASIDEFTSRILAEYKALTGCLPASEDNALSPALPPHYVASLDFGGDGGGMVSDDFWLQVCLPILKNRFINR